MAEPHSDSSQPLLSLRGVCKCYDTPAGPVAALRNVDLDIGAGEFIAVVGKSGSGKTTLVNLLTGIDSPSSGTIQMASGAVHCMSQDQLTRWRGTSVGIVFQFFQLLPTLTIAENVMLPMDFCRTFKARERRARALGLLSDMGIRDQADKLPSALSGGQQQRAAIARSLANDPPLIVADEPTGNLDSHTAAQVLAFFTQLVKSGKTVVMVTHERDLDRGLVRSITLRDGAIAGSEDAARC
jgi:putative ABC transport system ATP-binding protein